MSGFRFTLDQGKVLDRMNPRFVTAQKHLDSEVLRYSEPFVPMNTGMLVRSGQLGTVIGSGKIVYAAPYAKQMYYGRNLNFKRHKHPMACCMWFEKAKTTYKEQWIKSAQKIISGG